MFSLAHPRPELQSNKRPPSRPKSEPPAKRPKSFGMQPQDISSQFTNICDEAMNDTDRENLALGRAFENPGLRQDLRDAHMSDVVESIVNPELQTAKRARRRRQKKSVTGDDSLQADCEVATED